MSGCVILPISNRPARPQTLTSCASAARPGQSALELRRAAPNFRSAAAHMSHTRHQVEISQLGSIQGGQVRKATPKPVLDRTRLNWDPQRRTEAYALYAGFAHLCRGQNVRTP